MGWEQRGGERYYYQKQRRGSQVFSVYIGKGLPAQVCSDLDRDRRRDREARREALRAVRQADEEVDRLVSAHEAVAVSIAEAALHSAGFHKHKGQWRKKRHEVKKSDSKNG